MARTDDVSEPVPVDDDRAVPLIRRDRLAGRQAPAHGGWPSPPTCGLRTRRRWTTACCMPRTAPVCCFPGPRWTAAPPPSPATSCRCSLRASRRSGATSVIPLQTLPCLPDAGYALQIDAAGPSPWPASRPRSRRANPGIPWGPAAPAGWGSRRRPSGTPAKVSWQSPRLPGRSAWRSQRPARHAAVQRADARGRVRQRHRWRRGLRQRQDRARLSLPPCPTCSRFSQTWGCPAHDAGVLQRRLEPGPSKLQAGLRRRSGRSARRSAR